MSMGTDNTIIKINQLQQSTMDSQSQQFQPTIASTQFFSGFNQTPKLTEKQQKLRAQVYDGSAMETKQTSLQHKIGRIKVRGDGGQATANNKGRVVSKDDILREKLVVQSHQNSANKNNNQQKQNKSKKTFEDLRLIKPLLKAISDVQYSKPTPIQEQAIPVIMSGRDVVASSITGSGKTAAFLLPILQRYYNAAAVGYIRSLIVTPTRELAVQIYQQFSKLNKYTKLQAVLVIGAASIHKQESALRNHPELVIGTPGRIIDVLMNSRSIGMQDLQVIVFDEADKLLELGFEAEIKQIMSMINNQVQTVLFSATMGQQVNKLTAETTRKPIRISADPDHKTAQKLHQQVIRLRDQSQQYRQAVLLSILLNVYKQKTIVFFKTKKQCHRITMILGLLGIKACQLHGNLSQTQRLEAFLQFKEGKFQYMMATDLASRGLDIKQVKTVINYELPTQLTRYIHRIGRTARAGNVGSSLTLCNDSQCLQLKKMSKKTGDKLFKLTLDQKVIKQNIQKIRSLQNDISQIIQQQIQEKNLRKADMQLKKLQNINDYQDQIYSRPKKQWFITQKQKRKIQEKAKVQAGVVVEDQAENRSHRFKKSFNNKGRNDKGKHDKAKNDKGRHDKGRNGKNRYDRESNNNTNQRRQMGKSQEKRQNQQKRKFIKKNK